MHTQLMKILQMTTRKVTLSVTFILEMAVFLDFVDAEGIRVLQANLVEYQKFSLASLCLHGG